MNQTTEQTSTFRVLHLTREFPPSEGSHAQAVLDLALAQHRRGHRVAVMTLDAAGGGDFDTALPFRVIRVRARSPLRLGWRSREVLNRFGAHLVHAHGPEAAGLLARPGFPPVPVLVSLSEIQGSSRSRYLPLLKASEPIRRALGSDLDWSLQSTRGWRADRIGGRLMERLLCRRSQAVVLPVPGWEGLLRDRYRLPAERCPAVGVGTGTPRVVPSVGGSQAIWKIVGCRPGDSLLLLDGALIWDHRPDLVLLGFSQIAFRWPEARLLILGQGPLRAILERLSEQLGIADRIRFLPELTWAERPLLYQMAAALIRPSRVMEVPWALLDAMAQGLPVAASACLGHMELLDQGRLGLLVREDEPELWAAALDRLLARRGIHRMAEAARTRMKGFFQWEHVVERLDRVYLRTTENFRRTEPVAALT